MSFMAPPTKQMLDVLCPMHVRMNATGHITHVGPTLRKLRPRTPWIGERFLEVFHLIRPREVHSMPEFREIFGRKLHLELRLDPRTSLKGVAVVNGDDDVVVNMSFGISIVDAVRDFDLTNTDFGATDLTIEMLYLIEAQAAAMQASNDLNARLQVAKAEAERQAYSDPLTGLKNRRAMDELLNRMTESKAAMTLLHVDLDYFKSVNDTLGHAAGDFVLLQVAETFREVTDANDIVARVGGDEFVIILPDELDRDRVSVLCAKLIEELEVPMDFNGNACKISGSIGAVIWDGKRPSSPDTLLDDADIALYASKEAGRGRTTFYEPQLREEAQSLCDLTGKSVELWG